MGWISDFFASSAKEPIEAVGTILDDLFTSDEEKLDKKIALERLRQIPGLVQNEINKIEAQHRSIFVAGWRPFIGWICGLSLLYNFIVRDLIAWSITVSQSEITPPPELAMEHLMTVLMALLGLGGFRTFEKIKNKSK